MERKFSIVKSFRQNVSVGCSPSLNPTLRVTYSFCFSAGEASTSNMIIPNPQSKTDLLKRLETVDDPNTGGHIPVLETGEACV